MAATATVEKDTVFKRYYTKTNTHPYDQVSWKEFDAFIRDYETGETKFEQKGVLFPEFYSQNAVNIITSKYFRGIMGTDNRETSYKQLIDRVVNTNVAWGEEQGYFSDDNQKKVFADELTYILLHQMAYFNSPVWFNMGWKGRSQTASACFILGIEDSIESINECLSTESIVFKSGSGSGINFSALRSRFENLSAGGFSSGPLSFMKTFDTNAGQWKSGGSVRRAACMRMMNVEHPEIVDFIQCKAKEEEKAFALIREGYDSSFNGDAYSTVAFQNANHSVRVSDEFMKICENDSYFWTKFVSGGKKHKKYKAKEILRMISEATWKSGDPGMQFDDVINKWNTCKTERCNGTNPCVTGDTLVAVADGRLYVPIKQLVLENKPVPVYSYNLEKKEVEIKTGRNPRKTGENKKILKIKLDDGSHIRVTENHKMMLKSGEYVEAKDIKVKDRLMPFNKWESRGMNKEGRTTYWYAHLNSPNKTVKAEHNLIYEFLNDKPIEDGYCIHHKDYNGLNNEFDNLEYVSVEEHGKIHMLDYDRNPMQGGWWDKLSDEDKDKHREKMSKLMSGDNNPMFGKKHSDKTKETISEALKGKKSWCKGQTKHTNPSLMASSVKQTKNFGDVKCKFCGKKIERIGFNRKCVEFCSRSCASFYSNSNPDILLSKSEKSKEYWEKNRENNRELQLCLYEQLISEGKDVTRKSFKEEALKRNIPHDIRHTFGTFSNLKDECVFSNHKVIGIEEDGYEDVYNITVDDNHNLAYILKTNEKTKDNFSKVTGIFTRNCSEYTDHDWTSCNLASLNLMKFYDPSKGSFDVKGFQHACMIVHTAQDIWINDADYPTDKIAEKTKRYRTTGLGFANLGSLIMAEGLAYDSDDGRAIASAITSLMTGACYLNSAKHCENPNLDSFPEFDKNKKSMIEVLRMHRDETKKIKKTAINKSILKEATDCWMKAIRIGGKVGFRNSYVSNIAPTGCVHGETIVFTEDGAKRMASLYKENPFDNYRDLNKKVVSDSGMKMATKFYANGLNDTIRIKTKFGSEFEATEKHRVRVFDQSGKLSWKRMTELAEGDILPVALYGSVKDKKYEPLKGTKSKKHHNENTNFVEPTFVNEDFAEFLGYFYGDGQNKERSIRFTISNKDKNFMIPYIESLMLRTFGINRSEHIEEYDGCVGVSFNSKRLIDFLKYNKINKIKSNNIYVPDIILSSKESVQAAFFRGFFEADGSVSENGTITATSVSKNFIMDSSKLLNSMGILSKVDISVTADDVEHKGDNDVYRLTIGFSKYAKTFRDKIGFISDRKNNRLNRAPLKSKKDAFGKDVLDIIARKLGHKRYYGSLTPKLKNHLREFFSGFAFDSVESISHSSAYTYDLTVPDGNSYIAGNLISHNTIALAMDCDTTGLEPELALVKMKLLAGSDVSIKFVNNTTKMALKRLGYTKKSIEKICAFVEENGHVEGAPSLKEEHYSVFDCSFATGTRYIHHMGHLKMMAAIQPFISGASSKTINMPNSATSKEIMEAYLEAWKMGIKCVAIYRDGSKGSQVLSTIKKDRSRATRIKLPDDVDAKRHRFEIGGQKGYIKVGLYDDGSPGEVFLTINRPGSTVRGLTDTIGVVISIALQYGVPLKAIIRKILHTKFEPSGFTANKKIRSATSIVDYLGKYLAENHMDQKDRDSIGYIASSENFDPSQKDVTVENSPTYESVPVIGNSGEACPNCGSLMAANGSCKYCPSCGATTGCS